MAKIRPYSSILTVLARIIRTKKPRRRAVMIEENRTSVPPFAKYFP